MTSFALDQKMRRIIKVARNEQTYQFGLDMFTHNKKCPKVKSLLLFIAQSCFVISAWYLLFVCSWKTCRRTSSLLRLALPLHKTSSTTGGIFPLAENARRMPGAQAAPSIPA